MVLVLASALPMLVVSVPPLSDAPGHLGQYAVQLAPVGSPLRRYFDFTWAVRLNLGVDLLMQILARPLGIGRALWLVCTAIPVLTAAAAVLLARKVNAGVTAGTGWAMCFAYSYPFNYGFLNYCLGLALALLAFVLWVRMEVRPTWREPLFWLLIPALLVCHAIGGGMLLVAIVTRATGEWWDRRRPAVPAAAGLRPVLRELCPVLAAVPVVLLWRLGRHDEGLATSYDLMSKAQGIVFALRDQSRWLDLASTVAVCAVPLLGWRAGARYHAGPAAVVAATAFLYLAVPSELTGAWFTDMRLVPALAILALTLQDWSAVPHRLATIIAWLGVAVFAVRIAVTTGGFVAYDRSYQAEAAALPHIARGTRVLALVTRRCRASRAWRMDRLDHLPALATAERDAWVNAHWDLGDLHLLHIRFRPSPDFYDDPSHYVWPASCIHPDSRIETEEDRRNLRHTIEEVMPVLPLARVDYLWLIRARLPAGPWTRQLRLIWSNGSSSLYATTPILPRSAA